jgi:hypothetical protein
MSLHLHRPHTELRGEALMAAPALTVAGRLPGGLLIICCAGWKSSMPPHATHGLLLIGSCTLFLARGFVVYTHARTCIKIVHVL